MPVPISFSSIEAKMPPRRQRYREALTPLLHRRFTASALILLGLCWIEAIAIGSKRSFIWSWFPLGPVGIRSLLLFIPALSLFVMRVANIHFGRRTAPSPAAGFTQQFLQRNVLWVVVSYLFTAWMFYQIYVWSATTEAELGWVIEGRTYERSRLNERPIYLESHLLLLALYQTTYHIFEDANRVILRPIEPVSTESAFKSMSTISPRQRIKEAGLRTALRALKRAFILSMLNFVVYVIFVRRTAWDLSLSIARVWFDQVQPVNPPITPPFHYSLIYRSVTSAALLTVLWDVTNMVFDSYLAQPPLKRGRPLTDWSKDSNGKLIDGLKTKKGIVRTFAFWELLVIARGFEDRRKAIFEDIDRSGGSAWSQVLESCLKIIGDINTRITDKKIPPPDMTVPGTQSVSIQELPKLSAPLKQDTIFSSAAKPTSLQELYVTEIGSFAKFMGESPSNKSPLSKVFVASRDKLLTRHQQKALRPENLLGVLFDIFRRFLSTPLGAPFRQTFASRSRAKVLGTPISNLEDIQCAIGSITCLAVASLKEDQYGTVYKDVPLIIRTLVNITAAIVKFLRESPVHWTDVGYDETVGKKRVWEIDQLLNHLQCSLRFLLNSFEEYGPDMGLTTIEMKEAQKASGLPVS